MNDNRPDPDLLLQKINQDENKSKRGRLKIFLGMCPGVGKTYAMLTAAHELQNRGQKVFVGLVETHGRSETLKLVDGLDVVPRKKISYKNTTIEEMDLDALLSMHPNTVLIDELAHDNAPGSRHPKRYQDVMEVLSRGIDVLTTVNIQHVESRADQVYQMTGAEIRETVPDSFFDLADQIELIDLPSEDLLKRLKEGKVYLGERAQRAENNFFKDINLNALRELALRFTAEHVDRHLQLQLAQTRRQGPWSATERLLVALSQSPYNTRLIRATRRMAANLEAPWIAVYVETGAKLSDADQTMLNKNISLARELGAQVISTFDTDIAAAIQRISYHNNVTQIVIGRPDRKLFRDFFSQGTILDNLVSKAKSVDVHVLRHDDNVRATKSRVSLQMPEFHSPWTTYGWALLLVAVLFTVSEIFVSYIGYQAVGFVFLIGIMLLGVATSRGPVFLAAIVSVVVWNFFFIPPLYTFEIHSHSDLLMCVAFFVTAAVSGFLTTRILGQKKALINREKRLRVLYDLIRKFSSTEDLHEVATITQNSIDSFLSGVSEILVLDDAGQLPRKSIVQTELSEKDFALAMWSFENKKMAGWSTDTLPNSESLSIPLKNQDHVVGVLLFYPALKVRMSMEQQSMLESICFQLGLYLTRVFSRKKQNYIELLEHSETLHQTLLNSVSHELRTPLTSIIGSASALQDPKVAQSPETFQSLIQDLATSAQRLNMVIENLLDMSRLNSGILEIKKDWIELGELVSRTLQIDSALLKNHRVVFNEPKESMFIQGDSVLLQHALTNLVLNAAKYSSLNSEITIVLSAATTGDVKKYLISVLDEGVGMTDADIAKAFQPFSRMNRTKTGIGLGLSIVKGIMDSHQGKTYCESRAPKKGMRFVLEFEAQNENPNY